MSSLLERLYWKSPYCMKKWMTSMNARKLDYERFGPEFEKIVKEIKGHNQWSAEQFRQYQCQQLRSLIRQAAMNVPYYRKLFRDEGIKPESIRQPEDLKRLPILEKPAVRANPESLLDETYDKKKLIHTHTSGTTGTPLELCRDIRFNSAVWAYNEVRFHEVAGMRRRRDPSVSVGGQLVTASKRTEPPFWVYNRRWKQLYMSSFHLSPKNLEHYVEEMRKFKADYIEGYPSSVYTIARYIVGNNLEPVLFKVCFTTAEMLYDYQRDMIRKAFGCRTFNQYGCVEQVIFAAECPAGSMHLSPEVGIVRVVDDDGQSVPDGQRGHIICTGLTNKVQLFINYRLGDVGTLKVGGCSCGSGMPVLENIEGRAGNFLITGDRRQIGEAGLTLLFHGVEGVDETQFVQDDYDLIRVRIVPGKDYQDSEGQKVVTNLKQRLGDVNVSLECVEKIERTAAGKFRAIVSKLPANKQ